MVIIFILSELKPSFNCSVFTEPSESGPKMARTWPVEGPTFLQDKVSVTNFHMHSCEGYFSIRALLATVIFHISHPLALYPVEDFCWTMNTSWNDLPWKLWRNDHLNSDSVTVLLSQTVLIRLPAKSISTFFGARFVLMLLGKWPYFHFLSWYTYFLFIAVHVYLATGNLTSLSYWLLS